jgi:hypothetical protein
MNRMPNTLDAIRNVTLPNDFGPALCVSGVMIAEDIHFSQTSGMLTVEKLFRTQEGALRYGIISATGDSRERRAYTLEDRGDTVLAGSGACELELSVDALYEFLAMALQAEDAAETVGEHALMRQAVNQD